MDLENVLGKGLSYVGKVDSVRQRYFVFDGEDMSAIFSISSAKPNSGNFNLVSRKAVEYIHRKFRGENRLTSNEVFERAKRSKHIPTTLSALNVLYVLVAEGRARIEGIGSHSKLYFTVVDYDADASVSTKRGGKARRGKVKGKDAGRGSAKRHAQTKIVDGVRYQSYVVETFVQEGEPSSSEIRVRPVLGQGLDSSVRVKCAKPFRARHPIGTRFRMWARITDREGGTPFLYSPYHWEPELA